MWLEPLHLILLIWTALGVVWLIGATRVKAQARSQPEQERVAHVGLMVLVFLLLIDWRFRAGFLAMRFVPASAAASYAGLAMVVAGAAFAVWARISIGANWSGRIALKRDQELIRTGPYAIVRHPIYSGLLLAVLGTAVAIGRIMCLAGFALAAVGWGMKLRREERLLSEQFGSQYENYRKEVKGLIPFVV